MVIQGDVSLRIILASIHNKPHDVFLGNAY
jgi:hypothetical protein